MRAVVTPGFSFQEKLAENGDMRHSCLRKTIAMKIKRREFIKKSALGAGALALGGRLAAAADPANAAPAAPRRPIP